MPDVQSFSTCLAEGRYLDRIVADQTAVSLLGVRSIPAIVVNGAVVTGAKQFGVLDDLVKRALADTE